MTRDWRKQTAPFWSQFQIDHWEKKPTTFRWPLDQPWSDMDSIWCLLQKAADAWRSGKAVSFRYWGDGNRRENNLSAVLPNDGDQDVYDFAQRLKNSQTHGQFALMLNHVHHYDMQLWKMARRFVDGLCEQVGIPGLQADVDLIIGDYTHTGFGIHKDTASNFSLMIDGHKTILAWPDNYFNDKSVRMDPQRTLIDDPVCDAFRQDATPLSGGPGDVLYWPKSYWHVSDSQPGLSVTLSVALYLSEPYPGMWLDGLMSGYVSRKLEEIPTLPETFPADLSQTEQAIQLQPEWQILPSLEAFNWNGLQDDLVERWLSKRSAGGFTNFPRSLGPQGPLPQSFTMDTDFPILTHPLKDQLLVSSNGHNLKCAHPEMIAEVVGHLNRGGDFELARLMETFANHETTKVEVLEQLLQHLHKAGVMHPAEVMV